MFVWVFSFGARCLGAQNTLKNRDLAEKGETFEVYYAKDGHIYGNADQGNLTNSRAAAGLGEGGNYPPPVISHRGIIVAVPESEFPNSLGRRAVDPKSADLRADCPRNPGPGQAP